MGRISNILMVPIREVSETPSRSEKKNTFKGQFHQKYPRKPHPERSCKFLSDNVYIQTFYRLKISSCSKIQQFISTYVRNNRNSFLSRHLESELKKTRGLVCCFLPLLVSRVSQQIWKRHFLAGVSLSDPLRWVSGISTAPAFKHFVKAICCITGHRLQNMAVFWIFLDNQEKQPGCNRHMKTPFPGEAEDGICMGGGECGCSV